MAKNRQAAEMKVYEVVDTLLPGGGMSDIYKHRFSQMTNEEFDDFISRLDSGEETLAVIAPNFGKARLEISRNLEIAKKWGHSFFERIWMNPGNGSPAYLSPERYLVSDMVLRRQAQLQTKKLSTPDDSNSVDDFSGQPIGKSRGSTISYAETQILRALGLATNQEELLKWRGGDEKGFAAMNDSISKTGGASIASLARLGTEVKSTRTLSIILNCMHIRNTL